MRSVPNGRAGHRESERRNLFGWGNVGVVPQGAGAIKSILESTIFDNKPIIVQKKKKCPCLRQLPPPRLNKSSLPASVQRFVSDAPNDRAFHTYGQSFTDHCRKLAGDFKPAPDLVAFPETDADIQELLEWCSYRKVTVIPFGGGTSVVSGTEPPPRECGALSISCDVTRMSRVLEVDLESRCALIEAGATGAQIEEQLKRHGLSLRFFPQSFQFSTLGGWIATRAGGHYATRATHIDDLVESVVVVTPKGIVTTQRVPSSGAGPSEKSIYCGSEGTLGVITKAWIKVVPLPVFRASATVCFASGDFVVSSAAVRRIVQSGLSPANCRLVHRAEAMTSGLGDGSADVLLLGFESADFDCGPALAQALGIAVAFGGEIQSQSTNDSRTRTKGEENWRRQFIEAPYLRDIIVSFGCVVETFETCVTWKQWPALHRAIMARCGAKIREHLGAGRITCRITHCYTDGLAPYYTVIARGPASGWEAVKSCASETILEFCGASTHHHGVGRMHAQWFSREMSDLNINVLSAIKRELDPEWILSPGVLLAPPPHHPSSRL